MKNYKIRNEGKATKNNLFENKAFTIQGTG